jgi:hypothetical protein
VQVYVYLDALRLTHLRREHWLKAVLGFDYEGTRIFLVSSEL